MGLFSRLQVFYYNHVDDKVESVREVVGDKIICKAADHLGERVDRTVENWDAILASDPYIEGKEKGYTKAAELYEILFRDLQADYDKILKEAKALQQDAAGNVQITLEELEKKKKELLRLKILKTEMSKSIAESKGYSIYEIEKFTLFPRNTSVLDGLASKKLQQMKAGELNGFNEAKCLYEKKLNEQKDKFNNSLNELVSIKKEYIEIYKEILSELKSVNEQIIALNILDM